MRDQTFIGVDVDTKRIATALISPDEITTTTIERSTNPNDVNLYWERITHLTHLAASISATLLVEVPFPPGIRGGVPSSSWATYAALWRVVGELDLAAHLYGASVRHVEPGVWQRYLLRSWFPRRAAKQEAWDLACQYAQPVNEHEADAICIALYGHALRMEHPANA